MEKSFAFSKVPRSVFNGLARMSLWLSFASPAIAAAPPPELLRGPYLQSGTRTNVIVRWRTDEPVPSRVRFGSTANNLTQEVLNEDPTREHSVRLNGLTPDTKYYYSIGTTEHTLAAGTDYHFVTAPVGNKPTRVWVIGDSGTKTPQARAVFDRYREFNGARNTDVWLMLGDNAYGVGTDTEFQDAVFNMYPELLRNTILWSTMGNHETYSFEEDGRHAYFSIFDFPTAGQAGGVASGTEHYYSFDYGDIHFVCLDSEESGRNEGSPMLVWLEEDLAANTNEWLVAFWHSPPYTMGSHSSDNVNDNFGNMIEMRANIVPILESHGVDLVLGGHSHNYERSVLIDGHYGFSSTLTASMVKDGGSGKPEESGPYRKAGRGPAPNEGAVYVVAGSSGWATFQLGRHPIMHASLLQMGSLILDVDGPRLDAKFLRETGTIDDHFTILKGAGPEPTRFAVFRIRDGMAQAQFKTKAGQRYRIQRTLSLTTPDWEYASEPILATGATTFWSAPAEPGTNESYYRVVELD